MHIFNRISQEAKAKKISVSSRLTWFTKSVSGQSGLYEPCLKIRKITTKNFLYYQTSGNVGYAEGH